MRISKILIAILILGGMALLVIHRFFFAFGTSLWKEFLFLGLGLLCILMTFVIQWIAGEDAKTEGTESDSTDEKKSD